jgi:ubiquinone biosynthesis accessory factor UbiJ
MLHSLQALLAPALGERLTLLLNHVLAAESVATERLQPHRGAVLTLELEGWPSLLPAPPLLSWRITPAGLLQWNGAEGLGAAPEGAAQLQVRLDASNPALLLANTLAGEPPQVRIEGDAQLAGDVNWLLQNLRWDVAADLERLFGPQVAGVLHPVGRVLGEGLRKALQGLSALGEGLRARRG